MNNDNEDDRQQPTSDLPAESSPLYPVIGVGASAGGVQALRRLCPHIRRGSGKAYVIVLHLDPDHTSDLTEIVARTSVLPVVEATDDLPIEADHIYVIPPNNSLTISDGRLRLSRHAAPRAIRNTIDEFFVSLARDRADHAACIILSGTGSDGTLGLRAIKEAGGLTLAQAGAEYDGMMRSAVSTGLVDFVLPVEEIPSKLDAYFAHLATAGPEGLRDARADDVGQLTPVINLLRAQTGHDFSGYKDRTIIRRVRRRMHVLQIEDIVTFIERLQRDPHETTLLFQDLLIGVTNFFRDPTAFAVLENQVIPELFKNKGADETVRIWVPGCATGEEAYSLAILLRDGAPKSQGAPKLQIFATDIDESALDTARMGRYPAAVAKDIPAHHLERYFLREDGTYRIASDLREICLFSAHNLLIDPPFSKLDLISCRNLLIYLNSELQNRIIPLFHYSLNHNGYLFLGTSENVTAHSRLFSPLDKSHRIFHRRANLERQVPQFPLTAPETTRSVSLRAARRGAIIEPSVRTIAERQVLDAFAPAYVVVNADGEVLQSSGRTGKYLELPAGSPDTNVLNLARPGLRLDLRAALHRATSTGQPTARPNIVFGVNGGRQELDLRVQPLRVETPPEVLYLIVFQDRAPFDPTPHTDTLSPEEIEGVTVRQLEIELRSTKERLQTATEELESSNEELKSGNEELQSTNEELQSTNEELQTSKEELQSINEELQTVNSELNARVEELSRANNDMSNLLESTQIATVFLDRMLAVKSFTPAAKDVFRLVESDAERPIMHVRARFDCPTLQEDAERVLRTLGRVERHVNSNDSETRYIMRMLPYRTADNVINGLVLTFTDVTQISAAEAQIARLTHDLKARISELETLLELVPVGVMISEESTGVVINTMVLAFWDNRTIPRGSPRPFKMFEGDVELATSDQPLQRALRTGASVTGWQGRLENEFGHSAHVMVSATPLFGDDGQVRGAIAAIVDITQHKQAEAHQQLLLDELQHRVKNILATVTSLAMRMARGSRSSQDYQAAFISRLEAMGRVQDLLVEGAWKGASLRPLVSTLIDPYRNRTGTNVSMEGPDITLGANPASTMGVVINELATNASKYGALSVPGGHVEITWDLIDRGSERLVKFVWTERSGPAIQPDSTVGFGTGLITRSVEYELNGSVALDLATSGLSCTIEFPWPGPLQAEPGVDE